MFFFTVILLFYVIMVIIGGVPWMGIVRLLSGCKICYSEVVFIYVKSNILKYIPGNIFQYAGRNELAIVKNIRHSEVALATIIDVIWSVFSMLLPSILMLGDQWKAWLCHQELPVSKVVMAICALIVIVAIVFFILYKWKKQMLDNMISKVFNVKFLRVLLFNFVFYVLIGISTSGLYVAVFSLISGEFYFLNEIVIYIGIMLLAIVAGYITPGSPGGVGVREAVSLFFLKGMIDESVILSGIVITRIIFVIADFIAYIVVWIIFKMKKLLKKIQYGNY